MRVSPLAVGLLDLGSTQVIGLDYLALIEPREEVVQALRLLRTGALDSMEGRRRLRRPALERHLQRIAVEVQAAGVLRVLGPGADASRVPTLSELSDRQWEVVSRLARGERVSTIASEMYVSESTVRNHLSAIFRQAGVHSQRELLALLRRE